MKNFILIAAFLLSHCALAASYRCDIAVSDESDSSQSVPVGVINIFESENQSIASGSAFFVPISTRKNIFGKVVETVSVNFSGVVNAGQNAQSSSIEGEIDLVTTSYRKDITTTRVLMGLVNGVGAFSFQTGKSVGSPVDYEADGNCYFSP